MKAKTAAEVKRLQDIPNVGPAIARDLERAGVQQPADLKGVDGFALYQELTRVTGTRHDPCELDVFLAAVDFMNGAPAKPWWRYTKERKQKYPEV